MIVPTAAAVLEALAQPETQVLNLLAQCREPEYATVWNEGPAVHRRFARLLLKQGHPTLALEVAARGVSNGFYAGDAELLYCRALALSRSGNPTRAGWFVQDLLASSDLPPSLRSDALSLAGRIRKDFALRTPHRDQRTESFRQAFRLYLEAYELGGDTFPGINAATLARLVGDANRSRELAVRVRDRALDELERSDPGRDEDYWLLATLGEAYLLLGDGTAAKGRYGQAVRLARQAHNAGDIASMRRQLRMLKQCLPVDDPLPINDDLLGLFHLGPVIVFAGHGLDRPGEPLRFPVDQAMELAVRRAIKNELDALECKIGYCTPGCGSEILFGELMRQNDAELHLVLPFVEEDFCVEQITYGLEELEAWRQRYEKLRGQVRVTRHFATTEEFLNDQVLYDFAGTFMQGLAITRAIQLDVPVIALVVQDPSPQSSSKGLTRFMDKWRASGHEMRVIDLAAIRNRVTLTAAALSPSTVMKPSPQPTVVHHPRDVQTMLFADVAGFSGLPESHLPAFFIEFLAVVNEQLKTTRVRFQNTWGDGLYLVFEDIVACADFAMRLLRRLETFDFKQRGFQLPEGKEPGVRIGLHTGPVFKGYDAVIEKDNYFGSHVSRAARIEPVTAPGCAFVSEQFAAALALSPGHDFVCEYLGLQPLAKGYDVCHLYRLTVATDSGAPATAATGTPPTSD